MKKIALALISAMPISLFLLATVGPRQADEPTWPAPADIESAELAPAPELGPDLESVVQIVKDAAVVHNLPPMLVYAMAQVESGLRTDAVSPAGAVGVLQVVPETAGREVYRLKGRSGVPDRKALEDPRYNSEIAAVYLLWLIEYFRRQEDRRVPAEVVVAAYNGGPTRVQRCLTHHGKHWKQCLPKETQNYLQRVGDLTPLGYL